MKQPSKTSCPTPYIIYKPSFLMMGTTRQSMMPKVSDVYSNSAPFDDDAEGIGCLCKQLPLLRILTNSHRDVFVLCCTIR